ncbi:hypothetical protein ACM55I_09565 [Flavobacterium sp. GB2R13]|uniref:hypothetical protein n=1 Tax=Flavobacterium algoris TaxID=3398733 RepID=UPI003A85B407
MEINFKTSNNTETILEENPLLIILESKVIFKTDSDRISICLDQISNVRIIKNTDLTANILVLLFTVFLYLLLKLEFQDLNFISQSLYITLISILIVITLSIENYSYKLLINKGKFGFNEITISKKNLLHAKNFVTKFENKNILKTNKQEFNVESVKILRCLS